MRFAKRAPAGNVGEYDRRNLGIYAELVDASDHDVDWRRAAVDILELTLDDEDEALACWRSHLERARWITSEGLAEAILVLGGRRQCGLRADCLTP
jgi:hypothetical protein